MKKFKRIIPFALFIMGCFSCSNNEKGADVADITVENRLPQNFEAKPIIAPVSGVKVSGNSKDSLAPKVISNRLVVSLPDDTNLQNFVESFKGKFSGKEYRVISFDNETKTIELQVPSDKREMLNDSLSLMMPEFSCDVFSEVLYSVKSQSPIQGWHQDAINLNEAWNFTKGSNKVVVAVVDDGFDLNHKEFAGRIYKPYNIFSGDSQIICEGGLGEHGTHVAGTAVGSTVGVAPECLLMPIQVFDGEYTSTYAIMTGIMHAIKEGADVINLSAGPSFRGYGYLDKEIQREFSRRQMKSEERMWKTVFSKAKRKNVIVVLSAGNDHVLASMPAQNRTGNAIVVCASDENNTAASFSNYADCSTISAPGVNILSSVPGNEYANMSGTSMAAPVVTGIVALMKSLNSKLTYENITYVLDRTGKMQSGEIPPMVQVEKALDAVKKGKIKRKEFYVSKSKEIKRRSTEIGDFILYVQNGYLTVYNPDLEKSVILRDEYGKIEMSKDWYDETQWLFDLYKEWGNQITNVEISEDKRWILINTWCKGDFSSFVCDLGNGKYVRCGDGYERIILNNKIYFIPKYDGLNHDEDEYANLYLGQHCPEDYDPHAAFLERANWKKEIKGVGYPDPKLKGKLKREDCPTSSILDENFNEVDPHIFPVRKIECSTKDAKLVATVESDNSVVGTLEYKGVVYKFGGLLDYLESKIYEIAYNQTKKDYQHFSYNEKKNELIVMGHFKNLY